MSEDEKVYMPSWGQPMRLLGLPVLLMGAYHVLTYREHDWTTLPKLAGLGLVLGLFVFGLRLGLRVRVSPSGIRNPGGRLMKWSDVTEVEQDERGHVHIKSVYVPTIGIDRSIAADAKFRAHVLALVVPDHPLAKYLRERDP